MQPVSCRACGNQVLVAKYSAVHTSVQWLEDAPVVCQELARAAEDGRASALVPTCQSLRDTIDEAVRGGTITETRLVEPEADGVVLRPA